MSTGSKSDQYSTEQEKFWAGDFGAAYRQRNADDALIMAKIARFSRVLRTAPQVGSILELGCNIGLNLVALNKINPRFELAGYEINEESAKVARGFGFQDITTGTILQKIPEDRKYDLVFTAGVLIHINPDQLDKVYDNLYSLSKKYVLVAEYYNPSPVTVNYHGHSERLFKRDFAGELMDRYDLKLVDYGFDYHRDNYFDFDDSTWFLLSK